MQIVSREAPALAVRKRFERYKGEDEKTVRKPDVKEDEVLGQLKTVFKGCVITESLPNIGGEYDKILQLIGDIGYSSKDVEKFSIGLVEFEEDDCFRTVGLFLSALINNCKDNDFVIHTQNLRWLINSLGFRNTKNIVVNGNVGRFTGDDMQGGSIVVNGHTEIWLGVRMKGGSITVKGSTAQQVGENMEGGSIIVEGDTGHWVGSWMESGSITVKGNAGEDVGEHMKGGEIYLLGNYESIANIEGGKIYHKGELIVDK